jgi:hypothetical protein
MQNYTFLKIINNLAMQLLLWYNYSRRVSIYYEVSTAPACQAEGIVESHHIEQDTRALALPQGRRVGQPGHEDARLYLISRMNEIGLIPFKGNYFELPYTHPDPDSEVPVTFVNLAGIVKGIEHELAPILIGAHYDSAIDAPSANDNAAAVAVLLAVAERFIRAPIRRKLIFAIFDAEEPPFYLTEAMGSIRFYEDHCAAMEFACVIIMDIIGHDVAIGHPAIYTMFPYMKELLFVIGAESDRSLPGIVEHAAERISNLRVFPILNSYIGDMSDHHAFRLGNQPFLFLSCGAGHHYHQPSDDMNWVNLTKVHRVCEFVIELVAAINQRGQTGIARPGDTVDFEIRMIDKAIGTPLRLLLEKAGLPPLKSREDLDKLVLIVCPFLGV